MKSFLLAITLIVLPLGASAQGTPTDFKSLVNILLGFINILITAIFALAFIVIIWTIVQTWVFHGGDEKSIEEGKHVVTVAVLVLAVMSGIWGIIALLRAGFFGF